MADATRSPVLRNMAAYQSINSPTPSTSVQNRFSYPRNLSHNQYEEIVSWVECPTCKGSGKISKESEEEYIALIPLSDERLRPRRTIRYVGVTFVLCTIVVVALVVFLLPRSIVLSSTSPYIEPGNTVITNNGDDGLIVDMSLTNSANLTNYNFFGIVVTEITMDIFIGNVHIKSPSANIDVLVPMRDHRQLSITGNFSLASKTFRLLDYCKYDDFILRTVYMHFTFTVSCSYFGQTTQSTLKTVQGVDCYPSANRTSEAIFRT